MRKRSLSLLLALLALSWALLLPAAAEEPHWASSVLARAEEQGLMPSALLAPDEAPTVAEAAAALVRALNTGRRVLSAEGVSASDPLYTELGIARTAGILPAGLSASATLTRADAAVLLCRAWGLSDAREPTQWTDLLSGLTPEQRRAVAKLLSLGVMSESPAPECAMTRAEFLVLLERVRNEESTLYLSAGSQEGPEDAGTIFFLPGTSSVSATGETTDRLVVRSDSLRTLDLTDTTGESLVLCHSSGTAQPPAGAFDTVTLLGRGSLRLTGGTQQRLEILSEDAQVTLSGLRVEELVICGSGCRVTLDADCSVGTLTLSQDSADNVLILHGSVETARREGSGNSFSGKGSIADLTVTDGTDRCNVTVTALREEAPAAQPTQTAVQPETQPAQTAAQPETQPAQTAAQPETQTAQTTAQPETQTAQTTAQSAAQTTQTAAQAAIAPLPVHDDTVVHPVAAVTTPVRENVSAGTMAGAVISLYAPEIQPGHALVAYAAVTGLNGPRQVRVCWSCDGTLIRDETMTLTDGQTLTLGYNVDLLWNAPERYRVSLTVSDAGGYVYAETDAARAAWTGEDLRTYGWTLSSQIRGDYFGDWTSDWNVDYSDLAKEAFVNYGGYSSRTNWLVWVNRGTQKVNIFRGDGLGTWRLYAVFRCGSGAYGTPAGVTYIFDKCAGWWEATYTVYHVLNFYPGTGYAFHSRLYAPGGSDVLSDPSIGFPVSHGCVRMYVEDAAWMWDTIPLYTTVVVF